MKSLLSLGALLLAVCPAHAGSRLINGTVVENGAFREVVHITSNGAGCTATVVGPRVIVTAAHCSATGATAKFKIDGKEYQAKMTRSSLYPGKDHDVNLGVTEEDITGIDYASVGGKASSGMEITLLGYGCTEPGGHTAGDGKLRVGTTVVTGFSNYDMVSRKPGGAALCFGDSGGPAMVIDAKRGKHFLLGINSKGNIQDTNYDTRTDIDESQQFLKKFAEEKGVKICGVTDECGSTPPTPPAPTCTLAAQPASVKVGETVALTLTAAGETTAATIEGATVSVPTGSTSVTPTAAGSFTAHGTVTGPGGTGNCEATYVVEDKPPQPQVPTCTLTATPDHVKLGGAVTLELRSSAEATAATIGGDSVAVPVGKRTITTTKAGTFSVTGTATGAAGTGTCTTTYRVDDSSLPPNTPNLAVVPTYCGDNTITETKVTTVCLAVLKKDEHSDVKITQALLVRYSDATQEVMPIVSRLARPQSEGEITVKEDLMLYANASVKSSDFLVLDTRQAVLTSVPTGRHRRSGRDSVVPSAIEGRTMSGKYFLVDRLKPFGVSK